MRDVRPPPEVPDQGEVWMGIAVLIVGGLASLGAAFIVGYFIGLNG
jgi:hypothetical protein